MYKKLLLIIALLLGITTAQGIAAHIEIIPIEVSGSIDDIQLTQYLDIIGRDFNPTDTLPAAIIETLDLLGWKKHYDPANPLIDPDHPITVTIENNSSVAWTDFHFDVLPHPLLGGDMSTLSIEETSPAPASTTMLDDVVFNNVVSATHGPELHYWHWTTDAHKVNPGESVSYYFTIHNPLNQPFKLNFFPTTLIPEPISLMFLASGGLLLLRRK